MRKILAVALLIASFDVCAEWVYIQNSEPGTFFYDPSSVRISGAYVDVSTLFDMNASYELMGKSVMSQKGVDRYDCKAKRNKTMKIVDYAQRQGKGEVILAFDINNAKWSDIAKNSNGGALYEILCLPFNGGLLLNFS